MYVAANFGKETILLLDNPRRLTIDHIAITYAGYYSTHGTTKLRLQWSVEYTLPANATSRVARHCAAMDLQGGNMIFSFGKGARRTSQRGHAVVEVAVLSPWIFM